MPQKRTPIFHKVSNLFKVSIFVSKMRKPIIPKLIFFKKSRKLKAFMLLKHCNNKNYGIIEDYEFSASSTPLIGYRKRQFKNGSYRDNLYSLFLLCRCLGGLKVDRGELDYALQLETAAAANAISAREYLQPLDLGDEYEESVDQRAERFIERFYQEMRMQRQESI
ncbi:hypothetical protein JCGZ_18360 [Jatropha curcas]|uniref:Uncharacterized protein n=1 Tax=Jatropha curcas TaxID=180498 RepID=A0A067KC69_JATCU|nr:uncharacterized protein LOC105642051 [Jatropha curcas]KDP29439.1 hypothetical protein JCGZ_18360 [Jatropha curcas]